MSGVKKEIIFFNMKLLKVHPTPIRNVTVFYEDNLLYIVVLSIMCETTTKTFFDLQRAHKIHCSGEFHENVQENLLP